MDLSAQHEEVNELEVELGFSRPEEVMDDHEGRGLKRAVTRPIDSEFTQQYEYRRCHMRDWSAPGQPRLDLKLMGFDTIDIAGSEPLQTLLAQLRQAGEITAEEAKQLRRRLTGKTFSLSQRRCLKMLSIAPEGLIMRKSGPNGLKIDPEIPAGDMNGHDAAATIHADQDVRGTPLKQLMRGFAPWMFRHQTPDGSNFISPLMLVNVWIPLQQITRPLTLMDRRTLNAREHQLRYALPTDSFLDRSEGMIENDIWSFLYDEEQQWYFHSHMGHDKAYVFDTLGEPHGSFILPGENVAEHYYLQLQKLCAQLEAGEALEIFLEHAPMLPVNTTAPLRKAVETMADLVANVPLERQSEPAVNLWLTRAAEAMDAVVRKSLELRVVVLTLPDVWPFNR